MSFVVRDVMIKLYIRTGADLGIRPPADPKGTTPFGTF